MANQDISFCANRKCENTKCERHYSNIDWSVMPPWRSFVEFEGTRYCPENKERCRVMDEYINRKVVLDKLPNDLPYKASVKRVLIQAPAADVVEVKHGYWEEWWDDNYLSYCHKCSECGSYPLTKEETMHDEVLSAYCPNCGAKMDGRGDT